MTGSKFWAEKVTAPYDPKDDLLSAINWLIDRLTAGYDLPADRPKPQSQEWENVDMKAIMETVYQQHELLIDRIRSQAEDLFDDPFFDDALPPLESSSKGTLTLIDIEFVDMVEGLRGRISQFENETAEGSLKLYSYIAVKILDKAIETQSQTAISDIEKLCRQFCHRINQIDNRYHQSISGHNLK